MRTMKSFANVDVSETRHDPLIEQKRLDWRGSATQARSKPVGIQLDRFGPELGDRPPGLHFIGGDEIDRAEPARIVERDPPPVLRLDQQVIVGLKLMRVDPPLPGHSEMEDQAVGAVGVDEAELSATAKRGDPGARQPLAEIGGKGAAKVGAPQLDVGNALSKQHCLQAANGRFDFGKLRHGDDMAEPRQGR